MKWSDLMVGLLSHFDYIPPVVFPQYFNVTHSPNEPVEAHKCSLVQLRSPDLSLRLLPAAQSILKA